MLISLDKNIAFLAMTKTGSTSVEASLAPLCDILFTRDPRVKHMQLRRFERFIRPYLASMGYSDIQTTCLFRDPVDWLGSWYRYRSRPALAGKDNSTANITFDAFVESYLSDQPAPFAQIGRQSQFVLNKDGDVGMDHMFRFEAMEEIETFLSKRFGQTVQFDRLNVSHKADLSLSKVLLSELEKHLALDFEIHGNLP